MEIREREREREKKKHNEPARRHTTDITKHADKILTLCRDKKGSREFTDF